MADVSGRSGAPPSTTPLLVAYIAALAAGAATIGVALADVPHEAMGEPTWAALPVLFVLLVAAEYLFVRFRYRGDVNALNLVESVLAPLLFAFPSTTAIVTVAAAQLVGGVLRRNHPVKAAFNVAQWAFTTAVGATILTALSEEPGAVPDNLAALLVVLAVMGAVNQLAFATVLGIVNNQPLRRLLDDLAPVVVPGWVVGWAINSLIGLLFVLAYATHPLATLLFGVPLVMLHLAYRGYAGARSDRVRLTGLHRAARALAAPLDPVDAIEAYLREVATSFEARAATLILRTEHGRTIHHLDLVDRDYAVRAEPHATASLEGALLAQPSAARITAVGREPVAQALLAAGWRDCLSAPLLEDEDITGVLVVFDQAGLEGFEAGELAVLEALARETAGTFSKGHLLTAILEERRKLARIVQSTSDGILVLADDGTVLSWNPALEQLTGISSSEAVGRTFPVALRPRTPGGRPVDLGGWSWGRALPASLVIDGADSREHRLACSYSEASEDDSGVRTLVVVARDVTSVEEMEVLRAEFDRLAQAEAEQREVVERLQQALVPMPLSVEGLELGVSYVGSDPSAPTGGDLYDWHELPNGELHLAVIDVMGHGVDATKDALDVIHALRLLTLEGCPLEDVVARTDRVLNAQNTELVATVIVARYRPSDGTVRIAAGGHPPALLVSPTGGVRLLPALGGAIGWPLAGSEQVVEARLQPGDALVLYTDGLVEARKDLLEGMESLMRHAADVASLPAEDLAAGLVERALAGAARRDDSLALAVRRVPVASTDTRRTWAAPPDARRVGTIRRELRTWLAEHGLDGATADDVAMVAGELLSNAVAAALSSVRMRATVADHRVLLEIEDDGRGHEDLPALGLELPPPDAERGRGLYLVRRLVDDIAVLSTSEGTVITVERRLERSPRLADDERDHVAGP